ncbi:MAG: sugar O-acetyltransferase [Oscillospiraceae bacterium]|nr:sugar O-acetyltransferase [Oscillospiraceae bacterium]
MTEREKLDAGLEYCLDDAELAEEKLRAVELCRKLDALGPREKAAREAVVRELFGAAGEHPQVLDNFRCDNGKNIRVGDHFLANYNVTILDRAKVTCGDNVLLAPGVMISTVNHAMTAQGRRENLCTAKPITIGSDVWVGGNCVILPGVTIGDNVIVAAGAVVNRDVPDDTLVAGVPARQVKKLKREK